MLQRIAKLLRIAPPAQDAGLLIVSGTTKPVDGTAGYAVGCLFQHTDGGDGDALYVNEGTSASCDFNLVTVAAA